jgi:hypothetical protein
MTDFDRDPRVDRLLNNIGNEVAGYLDPRGVDMVYATVRQRRRNRALAVGALALALLGGPTVGLALASGDDARPPVGGEPSTTAPGESPSATASASSTPASPTRPAPDGRISLNELTRAHLDLPPWPQAATAGCKNGDVQFVGQPAYSDVDHDGAVETGMLLRCPTLSELSVYKVVVFDRNGSGKIVTVGQVLATQYSGRDGVDIRKVWAIQAAPDGQIQVDVGDYQPCCAVSPDLPQHQWRTYGWDGQRFTQTGGPRAFGPNPNVTDLTVQPGDLVMTQQAGGGWRGTLRITYRNAGPFPTRVELNVFGQGVRLAGTGGGWSSCIGVPDGSMPFGATCTTGTLAAGASHTLTLPVTATAKPSGTLTVQVGTVDDRGLALADLNNGNNRADIAVRAN